MLKYQGLEGEEVLDDLASFRVFVVKKLGMKLDAINPAAFLLHGLNGAGFVRRGGAKAIGHLLHFIAVVMPDGQLRRQSFEHSVAGVIDGKESTLAFRACVTLARFEPFHQADFSAMREGDLLMTAAHAENRLTRVFDHVENSRQ